MERNGGMPVREEDEFEKRTAKIGDMVSKM